MINRHFIILFALLGCGLQASAQIHVSSKDTVRTEREFQLDPIVVTSAGHHQRLKTTTTPVRVLSSGEIAEQGISTFDNALEKMLPQISLAPNSMGSQIRLNGLGNKYILVLINGHKLSGDISNNVDLNRINMGRVKRIEVLDGAASSLYGSDAIGGVINIITDQPTTDLIAVTSDTHVSGEGRFTESVNLDIFTKGFGSYTTFTHEEANSYSNNDLEYTDEETGETQQTIAPLYTGYYSNLFGQKFTYSVSDKLALNAGLEYFFKKTDRPETNDEITGGTDYEMRYKGLRWNLGAIYKFSRRNSLQVDFTTDRYRYGREYDVATSSYAIGDYVLSKKQKTLEAEAKAILGLVKGGTTVVGADWRKDYMVATSGSIDSHVYTLAGYVQHDQDITTALKVSLGARYTYHETFGSQFTPKFAVKYSVGGFTFRGTYSNGFRAPGLDELYYRYFSVNRGKAQISFGNKDLKAEKSHYFSLNAGYQNDFISVYVTGYINNISDMVVRSYVPIDDESLAMLREEFPEMTDDQAEALTQYSRYVNSDKGRIKGLQVGLSADVARGLTLSANYSYTHAKTKDDDGWSVLDRSIKNTVTLAANYNHNWRKYTLNVNLNGRMQSKTYYTSYENAPGYGVWNINTTHTFRCLKWALLQPSIGIDNIFDRVDRRIDSSLRRYALYSPGRMLTVGLKVKFS